MMCLGEYRITSTERRGAYLKLKIFDAALNRARRLFEGVAYSKIYILDMNYFSSEDKINKSTNYSQNINVIVVFFILINQLTDKIHNKFFRH